MTTVSNLCVTFVSGAKSTSVGTCPFDFSAAGAGASFTAAAGAGVSLTSAAGAGVSLTSAAGVSLISTSIGVASITSGSFSILVGSASPLISASACSTEIPKALALASAVFNNKCSGISTIYISIEDLRFLHPFLLARNELP